MKNSIEAQRKNVVVSGNRKIKRLNEGKVVFRIRFCKVDTHFTNNDQKSLLGKQKRKGEELRL